MNSPSLATPVIAYLSFGSNLGDSLSTITHAYQVVGTTPGISIKKCSSFYQSAPIDAGGNNYLNSVLEIETTLSSKALLCTALAIEKQFGRVRHYRNDPRCLDIDILLYDHLHDQDNEPYLPHPRMYDRAFVLLPLHEIAPQWVSHEDLRRIADQIICRINTPHFNECT